MNTKYFFSLVALFSLLFVSCDNNDDSKDMTYLDDVKVSSSYVGIDTASLKGTIIVTAVADWTIELDSTTGIHEWLTIDPMQGSAGVDTLTLTASSATGNSGTFYILCNGKKQTVNVVSGEVEVTTATVKEVMLGAEGKTYRVTGAVTKIANTTYGNFYMNDGTYDTDLYIYGTLTPDGQTKQWATFGIEEGDIVTVEGPKTLYNGTTVELIDATLISVEKSLIKVGAVSPEDATLPLEGGLFTVGLMCKGQGVTVDIPADAQEWLSIASVENAADTATVTFKAAANNGGDRSTAIIFHTTDGNKDYTATTTLMQKGAVIKATTAEFIAAPVGDTQYRMKVAIEEIYKPEYGNLYVRDGFSADKLTIYGTKNFADFDLKAWDVVTLVTPRAEHKGTPQGKDATIEEVIPVTTVTAEEFNALEDSNDKYYKLTGTVTNIVKADYGNIYIEDETGEVYLYGVLTGIDGAKQQFESLGVKVGDEITVITIKTSYKDSPQGKNAWYIKHTPAAE